MAENGIEISIINFGNGLTLYHDVQVIRIRSHDYHLMIMSDHSPILGEVDGDIIILQKDKEIKLEHVKGFFTHVKNHFRFIQSDENL